MVATCKWGILGCGAISKKFTQDLLAPTSERGVSDVKHIVSAIGSSSVEKARKFARDCGVPDDGSCHLHGSYAELLADPEPEVIYIATPHSHHYKSALDSLNAGKHVLCEKPLTVTAAQSKRLVELAQAKKLFFMEAVWTRFFPLTLTLRKMLFEDKVIGRVSRIFVDFGFDWKPETLSADDRAISPALAGGGLLDLGPYPTVWAFMVMHDNPENPEPSKGPEVKAQCVFSQRTPVDESMSWTLTWPAMRTIAMLSTTMINKTPDTFARIEGKTGFVTVSGLASQPRSFTVHSYDENVPPKTYDFPIGDPKRDSEGLFWEADEVARCLAAGKTECPLMTHQESLIVMETFDKIREQVGLKYGAIEEL